MKNISIDFLNNIIYMTTEEGPYKKGNVNLCKKDFQNFIPSKYMEYDLFTWNFQNETFSVNQENKNLEGSFKPQFIIPMSGLKKHYKEFVVLIGEENAKKESSSKIKKLFGL